MLVNFIREQTPLFMGTAIENDSYPHQNRTYVDKRSYISEDNLFNKPLSKTASLI
ncbi:MAG: hypothetical protein QMC40_07995 [Vicingaceae bacterium]